MGVISKALAAGILYGISFLYSPPVNADCVEVLVGKLCPSHSTIINSSSLDELISKLKTENIESLLSLFGIDTNNIVRYEVNGNIGVYTSANSEIEIIPLGFMVSYNPNPNNKSYILKPKKIKFGDFEKDSFGKQIAFVKPFKGNPFMVVYNPKVYGGIMETLPNLFSQHRKHNLR